jgi:recombination protein RecA
MAKKEAAPEKQSTVNEEKTRALEATRLAIEKQFGKGSLMKLGESVPRTDVDIIPSGSILLDAALGVGARVWPPSTTYLPPNESGAQNHSF